MHQQEIEERVAALLATPVLLQPTEWDDRNRLVDEDLESWREICELAMMRSKDPLRKAMFELERLRAVLLTLKYDAEIMRQQFEQVAPICPSNQMLSFWFHQNAALFQHLHGDYESGSDMMRLCSVYTDDRLQRTYWSCRAILEHLWEQLLHNPDKARRCARELIGKVVSVSVTPDITYPHDQRELRCRCIVAAFLAGLEVPYFHEHLMLIPGEHPRERFYLTSLADALQRLEAGIKSESRDVLRRVQALMKTLIDEPLPECSAMAILVLQRACLVNGDTFILTPQMQELLDQPGAHLAKTLFERSTAAV